MHQSKIVSSATTTLQPTEDIKPLYELDISNLITPAPLLNHYTYKITNNIINEEQQLVLQNWCHYQSSGNNESLNLSNNRELIKYTLDETKENAIHYKNQTQIPKIYIFLINKVDNKYIAFCSLHIKLYCSKAELEEMAFDPKLSRNPKSCITEFYAFLAYKGILYLKEYLPELRQIVSYAKSFKTHQVAKKLGFKLVL